MKHKKEKSTILLIAVLIGVFIIFILSMDYISEPELKFDDEYRKCTSVCASTLNEEFVTSNLCREQCKKELLKRMENDTG